MSRRFTVYVSSLSLFVGTLLIPAAAVADYPDARATPGQVRNLPSGIEFDWTVTGGYDDTKVTVTYTGCGGQVAAVSTGIGPGEYTFTVYADADQLGPDWTRTLTIEEPGFDTYTETVQNSDPTLAFSCPVEPAQPLVETWSDKQGRFTIHPEVGKTVSVSPTTVSDYGLEKGALLEYAWYAGTEKVDSDPTLTIEREWIGRELKMVVTVSNSESTETHTLLYGTVPKLIWHVKRVERCPGCNEHNLAGPVRVLGPDGAGVFVYEQYRHCGHGKWKNFRRQTTTARGMFDFNADTPRQRRKYHEKRMSRVPEYSAQGATLISGNDDYKAIRFDNLFCL